MIGGAPDPRAAPETPIAALATPIAALATRIAELRAEARYAEALALARELRGCRSLDPGARPHELADAERLVHTLEAVASLPDGEQRELAEADRLDIWLSTTDTTGEYAKAAEAARRQHEIRRRLLGEEHHEVAASACFLAYCLMRLRDLDGAEPLCRQALDLRRRRFGDDHPDVATNLHVLASLLQGRGDYAGAESLYRQALAIEQSVFGEEHGDAATTLNDLALVVKLRGDHTAAEPIYRRSLAMRRRLFGDESVEVAQVLHNLAKLHQAAGDYATAEPLLRRAVATRRRLLGDHHPGVARSLDSLAALLHDQGDLAAAEPLYREALELFRSGMGEDSYDASLILGNLAGLLRDRGDLAASETACREALSIQQRRRGRGHPDFQVAAVLAHLAEIRQDRGDLDDAEALMREALDIRRRAFGAEHPYVARSLFGLAALSRTRGDDSGAQQLLEEALAMNRKLLGEAHPALMRNLTDLAALHRDRGDDAGAERLHAEAARAFEAARLRAGAGVKRAMFVESPYEDLAADRLALGWAASAWQAAERSLGRVLADILVASDQRSLSPPEIERERVLKSVLVQIESQITALETAGSQGAMRASGEIAAVAAPELLTELRNRLLEVEAEWGALEREIAAAHPVTEGQAYDLERIQSVLSPSTAIVGWLDVDGRRGGSEAWGYVVRSSGPVFWACLFQSSPSQSPTHPFQRVRAFRDRLANHGVSALGLVRDGGWQEVANALWRERFAPLAGALTGASQLVVIPSGAMTKVPVEALVDADGVSLGERVAVSYVPSATIFAWLMERRNGRPRAPVRKALLVGDPPFRESHRAAMLAEATGKVEAASEAAPASERSGVSSAKFGSRALIQALPRLRWARREVLRVSTIFSEADLLLGPDASEQELARLSAAGELARYEVIHLATHALVDDEQPERSALVLSQVDIPDPMEAAMAGGRVYDGLLTAREIVREWELSAELVTLSACETGLGREVRGEGPVGFAHAFLQAGARTLLVSLWKVDDEATALLMRRFYENWTGAGADEGRVAVARPMAKAEALAEAKCWLRSYRDPRGRRPFEHPYYWSPFILFGDPH